MSQTYLFELNLKQLCKQLCKLIKNAEVVFFPELLSDTAISKVASLPPDVVVGTFVSAPQALAKINSKRGEGTEKPKVYCLVFTDEVAEHAEMLECMSSQNEELCQKVF